jgi:hypothetical protein
VSDEIWTLIERARGIVMSEADREEQRRSFAFGNTALENPRITRDLIDREAETLRQRGAT